MKKILFTLLAAGAFFTASAQTKSVFGIKGGVNFASWSASADGMSGNVNSGTITSFSAGVFADLPVSQEGLSIQPGLFYTGKGANSNDGSSTGKIKLAYLQLPVNIVYNVQLSGGKFFFGAGPYAAYGLSAKGQDQVNGRTVSVDLEMGNDVNSDIKRTDFGATGLIGFQLKSGLLFSVNYDLGLSNVIPGDNLGGSVKNRVVGISVGYKF